MIRDDNWILFVIKWNNIVIWLSSSSSSLFIIFNVHNGLGFGFFFHRLAMIITPWPCYPQQNLCLSFTMVLYVCLKLSQTGSGKHIRVVNVVCVCVYVSFFHSFFSVVQLIPSTETRVNFRCCRFFRFCCYCCYFRESGIIFFLDTRNEKKKRPIWSNLPVIRFVYFRIFLLLLLLFLPHHQNGNRIWKRTKKKSKSVSDIHSNKNKRSCTIRTWRTGFLIISEAWIKI